MLSGQWIQWGMSVDGICYATVQVSNSSAQDYINFRGIEMVRTLRFQTIRERIDYFLCVSMFKCIHGFAPHYLCNDVTMYIDINGYDTRSAKNIDLYLPRCWREIYKRSFLYKGSSLWNQLPSRLKESISIIAFKRNYRLLYAWV